MFENQSQVNISY